MIGSLGEVVFSVSSEYIKTFQNFNLKKTARITQHDVIGQKSVLEFGGAGLLEGTLDIQLRADLGVNVEQEIGVLMAMMDDGFICPFILGSAYIGDYLISDVSAAFNIIRHDGITQSATVSVSIKEYANAA